REGGERRVVVGRRTVRGGGIAHRQALERDDGLRAVGDRERDGEVAGGGGHVRGVRRAGLRQRRRRGRAGRQRAGRVGHRRAREPHRARRGRVRAAAAVGGLHQRLDDQRVERDGFAGRR